MNKGVEIKVVVIISSQEISPQSAKHLTKVSITSHRNYTSRLMHTRGNAKMYAV